MESNTSSSIHIKHQTVREVADIISGIHGRIVKLHECSSDDFLALNNDFKRYYQKSKQIADNASTIFHLLSGSDEDKLIANLRHSYKDIKHIQNQFTARTDSITSLCKGMFLSLDGLFLPIKNLGQDLMTLKFLITNLSLTESSPVISQSGIIEKLSNIISQFKASLSSNEQLIGELKVAVKETLIHIETSAESTNKGFETISNHIHLAIIYFAETHQEVTLQMPSLTEKVEGTSSSLDEIITNLQYHDIIRQKIEHIQTSQKGLLDSIDEVKEETTDGLDKLIIKVRDVANLHAAQLVNANKEYQNAIERITSEFLLIENGLNAIANLCNSISSHQKDDNDLYLNRIVKNLTNSSQIMHKLADSEIIIGSKSDSMMMRVEKSFKSFKMIHGDLLDLKSTMNGMMNAFSTTHRNGESVKTLLTQIQTLFNDIAEHENTIQESIEKVNQLSIQNPLPANDDDSNKQPANQISLPQGLNESINKLQEKNSAVNNLLNRNMEMSSEISAEVRSSIHNIKYYDFFDKEIVEIIDELKSVSEKLFSLVESTMDSSELESVRELYTMSSEHTIHDNVTQGSAGNGNSNATNEGEDDDNIEFF